MALMLPSLSGLSSLTVLNLSDCNLGEGDIPSDISCLSSLEVLILNDNNFISIPSSFNQLSKLQWLELSNCKQLKSFPELPTAIEWMEIGGCASLELIANPSKVCNSMDWAWVCGLHCYILAEKMNALTLLKRHLKVLANSRKVFDIILPGNEIPEWFSHKRVGSSIKIRMPLNIRDDSQWMGVALCCIFVNSYASRDVYLDCDAVINNRCVNSTGFIFLKRYTQPILRDHVFLHYLSRDELYRYSLEDKCGEGEIDNLSTSNCSNQEGDEFELLFKNAYDKLVNVKQCGVRLVYQKDLEDIQLIKEQYNNQGSA